MRGDGVIDRVFWVSLCGRGGYENFLRELLIIDPASTLRQITVKWSSCWKNGALNPSSSGLTFFLYCLCREEGCNNSTVWKNTIFICQTIDSKSTFNYWLWNCNRRMIISLDSKLSNILPSLSHWIPGQNGRITVWIIVVAFMISRVSAGHEKDIAHYRSSEITPLWRKLSRLHLPPL